MRFAPYFGPSIVLNVICTVHVTMGITWEMGYNSKPRFCQKQRQYSVSVPMVTLNIYAHRNCKLEEPVKPSTEIPEDPVPDIPPPHSRMSKKGPTTAKSVEPSNDRRSPQKPTAKRKASLKPNSPVAQTVPHEDQQPRLVVLCLHDTHPIYDPLHLWSSSISEEPAKPHGPAKSVSQVLLLLYSLPYLSLISAGWYGFGGPYRLRGRLCSGCCLAPWRKGSLTRRSILRWLAPGNVTSCSAVGCASCPASAESQGGQREESFLWGSKVGKVLHGPVVRLLHCLRCEGSSNPWF